MEIRPQEGPQEQFLASPADIVIFGGAAGGGKSRGLLMESLRNIDNPNYNGVLFRKTYPQIMQPGGLWDESVEVYTHFGGIPHRSVAMWRFPSGAKIKFAYLDKKVNDWQGAQIPFIGFDELTHYQEYTFWYLLSRNRSTCGVPPYVRATCNPDSDSWVARLIAWWIDQDTGYPIPERSGVIRWYYRVDGEICWYDSKEEAEAAHPNLANQATPKSFTFILSRLTDNKILMNKDPGYMANLLALPIVERERLLMGNWKIRSEGGKVFRREWFGDLADAVPVEGKRVRYWDKAATPGGGDFSVGVLMVKAGPMYYVEDVIRGQWSALERNTVIRQTAAMDAARYGNVVNIWLEQEGGSGGRESTEFTIQDLAGYPVYSETMSSGKIERANPLAAQVQAGNVRLKRAHWNDAYLSEMEAFPDGTHDDQVDASSGAFNKLSLIPTDSGSLWSMTVYDDDDD